MASNRSPEDMKRERDPVEASERVPHLSSVGVSDEKDEGKSPGGVVKALPTQASKTARIRNDSRARSNVIGQPGLKPRSEKTLAKSAKPDTDKNHAETSTGTPSKRLTTGLTLRIVIGMTAVVLAMTLILGVLAGELLNDAALPAHVAQKIRNTLLIWGVSGVAIACVLGALIARQISAPIHRLTRELKDHDIRLYPWSSNMRHEFRELEELSGAMEMLAASVRQRERELSESERKFREAFDLVGIGLTQVDVDGRFVAIRAMS
jgi:hypothetical protein